MLNNEGPLFPREYEMDDFSMRVFIKGGSPIVVNYSLKEGASATLSIEAGGRSVFPLPQTLPAGKNKQLIFRVPNSVGTSPQVAKLFIRASNGNGGQTDPSLFRVHAIGMGEVVTARRNIHQLVSYVRSQEGEGDYYGRLPPVSPFAAQEQGIAIDDLTLDPTTIEKDQGGTVNYGFHSLSPFSAVAAQFWRLDSSLTGRVKLVRVFSQRLGVLGADETVARQWDGRMRGGAYSVGLHQLKVRAWWGESSGGQWLSVWSELTVVVE